MALDLDPTTLAQVVNRAQRSAAAHPRWIAALDRAVVELETNPYLERDADHGGLLIGSPSGQVYTSNGSCQCVAYSYGQPCWHRAAARLARLHDEALAEQDQRAEVHQIASTIADVLQRHGVAPDEGTRARWSEVQRLIDELY